MPELAGIPYGDINCSITIIWANKWKYAALEMMMCDMALCRYHPFE